MLIRGNISVLEIPCSSASILPINSDQQVLTFEPFCRFLHLPTTFKSKGQETITTHLVSKSFAIPSLLAVSEFRHCRASEQYIDN